MITMLAWYLIVSAALCVPVVAADYLRAKRAQVPPVKVADMQPRAFLLWFLRNHAQAPLIAAGLWKKPAFVADDLGDEGGSTVQAAYIVGGEQGAWPVVIALIRDEPVSVTVEPADATYAAKPLKALGKKGLDYFDWEVFQSLKGRRR